MPENTQLLKCPGCGAPLDPPAGQTVMKCPYCHSTVEIPSTFNTTSSSTITDPDIARILELIQSGNKIEAIKVIRESTDTSLTAAKNVLEAIERGEPVDLQSLAHSSGQGVTGNPSWASSSSSAQAFPSGVQARTSRSKGIIMGIAVALVLLMAAVTMFFVFAIPGGQSLLPLSFAHQLLAFGTEGTGAGMLNDSRYVGVDRNGNMYVGDYQDGRVNVFDSTGKFLRLINLGNKLLVQGMAVAADGTLYYSANGTVQKRDSQGNITSLTYTDSDGNSAYLEDFALGADGSVYAADEDEDVVRFGPDGKVSLVIPKVFSSVTGDDELDMHPAVDGTGNIYVLGTFNNLVMKYGPEGKYLNQFGGEAPSSADSLTPGRFDAPDSIAVDGYGRIYVSDFWGVQVFDSNGQYQNSFGIDGAAYGMSFDLDNNLYIASSTPQILKFSVKQP
jgi:LSD1 subclass zinc finger protein